MFLNDEESFRLAGGSPSFPKRLGRLGEISLARIVSKTHGPFFFLPWVIGINDPGNSWNLGANMNATSSLGAVTGKTDSRKAGALSQWCEDNVGSTGTISAMLMAWRTIWLA